MAKTVEYFMCKRCGCKIEMAYLRALKLVITFGTTSISMLQRKLGLGYNKAGEIILWMEEMKFISSFQGTRPRDIYITKEKFEEIYGIWEEI